MDKFNLKKEGIKFIVLFLETCVLNWSFFWYFNDSKNIESIISILVSLIAVIGTLAFLLKKKDKPNNIRESGIFDDSLISAKVIEHLSDERGKAFNDLRQNISKGDEIWILGTGVTSFLNEKENLEIYLKNGARIKILMINNKLLRNTRECQGELGIMNYIVHSNNIENLPLIEQEVLCDIDNYNFLIKKKHFDKYFSRENYHEDIQESYHIIEKMQKKIIDNNWDGNLEAKHFLSFMPLSMTAIITSTNKKMIIEFILPFSEKRLMIKSSSIENTKIFDLFIKFFKDTWRNSKKIEQNENR